MESILVVDDDSGIRKQLKWGLNKDYKGAACSGRAQGAGTLQTA